MLIKMAVYYPAGRTPRSYNLHFTSTTRERSAEKWSYFAELHIHYVGDETLSEIVELIADQTAEYRKQLWEKEIKEHVEAELSLLAMQSPVERSHDDAVQGENLAQASSESTSFLGRILRYLSGLFGKEFN
jgi:hypothetical protein